MTDRLDVASLAPGDRADAIRAFSWSINGRIEVDLPPDPNRLKAHATTRAVGSVKVSEIGWNVARLRRAAAAPVDEDMTPQVLVHLQEAGVSRFQQGGRQSVTRAGDLAVIENAKPYEAAFHGTMHSVLVRVPTRVLGLRPSLLDQVTAVRIGSERPVVGAAAALFARLARDQAAFDEAETALFAQPCVDLIRAVVSMTLGRDDLARAPLNNTLLQRVQEYVRLHLAEPDLTAARIAAEHQISVRQLYLTLSRAGITLGDWIRTQRLEECKRELASSAYQLMTIEAIAHRWGFASAPHFSRVFKAAYGVSPRGVRSQTRGGESGLSPATGSPRRGTSADSF
ncbi:AraC-like ligand-binding domain-containing protein [Actinacidiphila glaucinigra]|uniref:Helix-turn-helix domain-containing protein n=1 Tax=Actinacidiphila glaucinigra TaxID=235986 RepID=A0A239IKE7_9ACTN|nr:helix-turn-helix domain-containing protein [Actinacidiphila glaucinigra]SNS94045.1 Helix-turn-helix domain-containing protein [Actinacidiphila glaucinigra]